jgi:hypothetical protein
MVRAIRVRRRLCGTGECSERLWVFLDTGKRGAPPQQPERLAEANLAMALDQADAQL